MAEPKKRQRLSHVKSSHKTSNHSQSEGDERFVDGSIISITMKNFLTYDYSVVNPGTNLNMIVGANGTGKSSIVCAICLGLAGKTSVLGRGDKVGLYVKRGCKKGFIEIELYKKDGNVVIHREIHVENNRSVWMLNKRHCSQKDVEEEVRTLQIQVSNLCQFLPQEKVGEFAKMSKIELLEATEKSVGPPEMYEYHCKLKNFRGKERELENAVKEKNSFLEKAKQRNERNKLDVNRFYERQRHLDMIELLEKKKPWVEYETARVERDHVIAERNEVKQRLITLKQVQAPVVRKIQQIENQLHSTECCAFCIFFIFFLLLQIDDIKQSLKLKQTEAEDQQKRIGNTRRNIEDLKAELAKTGDQPDVTPQINAINVELRQMQQDRARIEGEKADLRREKDNLCAESAMLEKKLNCMNNMMNAKEEKLKGRHKDTYVALQWLRKNRQMFEGNVYEPMMLVINVKDHRFAKYVENHIPFHDLRAFVFQKKADMEKFMTEVRDKMNLRVNAISTPEKSFSEQQPSRHIESLRRFGFHIYLREMFDTPEEVMSYLCYQYKVHEVPLGSQQTKDMIHTVIEEPYLRMFYTPGERYMVKRSSYSHNISTSNSLVQESQFLTITVDADEKRRLEEQIKVRQKLQENNERMKNFQAEAVSLDRRDNELLAEKKRLSELKGKKRQLEQKISIKQDSVRQMEQNVIDLAKIEEETREKIANVNSQKVSVVAEFMAQMKVRMEKVYLTLDTVGQTAEKRKLENDFREGTSELKTVNVGVVTSVNLSLFAFSKLPDTLDEIDARLNEERSRSECFTGLSESVVDEYRRREEEIRHLEKELEEKTNSLTNMAKDRWLNPLKQLVEQINEKFSDFFRSMQCAGEVDLYTENEEEYDKYGIRIRVKVVDEINQGMDPVNERRVFDIVVRTACKETTSQYFFITPKLLQNLQYADEMTILCVHNGPYMLPPSQWNEKALIKRCLQRKARA
uniref:Structural maintenance of chromosomes protein 5 n=1 Tax=Cynoglossus semilaevis TaxID=244447 RepID=A0A3P8UR75_CYNSE